jgi:hypothetical protein
METKFLTMVQKSRFLAFASARLKDGGDDDDTETPSDEEGCPEMPDYADADSQA